MGKQRVSSEQVQDYWKKVSQRAWDKAWQEASMRVIIIIMIGLAVSLVITGLLVGFGAIPLDIFGGVINDTIDGFKAFGWTVFATIVLYILGIFRIPAELHEELGGFIENPIDITAEPHPDPMGNVSYTRGLHIENKTALKVNRCTITLVSAVWEGLPEESYLRREELLSWSSRYRDNQGNKVTALPVPGWEYRICDLVIFDVRSGNAWFGVPVPKTSDPEWLYEGRTKVTVRLNGEWGGLPLKGYTKQLDIYFRDREIYIGDEIKQIDNVMSDE